MVQINRFREEPCPGRAGTMVNYFKIRIEINVGSCEIQPSVLQRHSEKGKNMEINSQEILEFEEKPKGQNSENGGKYCEQRCQGKWVTLI